MDAEIRSFPRRCYAFGPFAADCRKRLLWRDGSVVPLTPKAFEILATLIEHRGQVVDKDELLREVWGDVAVEDATLARHISTLRHALGERPSQHTYVVTVPGKGYEFVAKVDERDEPPPVAETTPPLAASAAPAPSGPGRTFGWPLAVAAVLTVVVAAAAVLAIDVRQNDDRVAQRGLQQFTFRGGLQGEAAWSPDGQ